MKNYNIPPIKYPFIISPNYKSNYYSGQFKAGLQVNHMSRPEMTRAGKIVKKRVHYIDLISYIAEKVD